MSVSRVGDLVSVLLREASDLRRMIMDSKVSVANDFSTILHERDAELLAELHHYLNKCKKKAFHIIHICTEMAPVISVGSLAPYVTGLSLALQRKGHLVEVILPKYAGLNLDEVEGLREIEAEFYSYFNGQLHANRIWTGFIYFSRASLDYIVKSGKQPDVLHIHNWQTAIVGPLFWDVFVKQCLEQPDKLALCGLDPSRLHRPDRLQDNTKTHLANILKGGIVYSNKVITMSSIHSKDLIIRSLSHGLEPTLAIHKNKLLVAPYGFDNSAWNPSMDHFLPHCYGADDLKGKAVCKLALQQHAGLSENASVVLVSCVFLEVSRRINRAMGSFQEELKLKAIRYGAAPVAVMRTDSQFRQIIDHDFESTRFSQYISNTFGNLSLSQAIDEIKNNPSQWNRKIADAMTKDFSWDAECCDIHDTAYASVLNL
ncbi:UDP-Glycosyltransferase superfamily protein [Actinidia rufa]|uniref:starch synthase n=1 Tax=Actinidia rufa TaxID=165716 RepID=A0A7J0EJZ1_9ERIC|nr:UDP-Glycosyltransferase superfamily protein [Actinidia rufa]